MAYVFRNEIKERLSGGGKLMFETHPSSSTSLQPPVHLEDPGALDGVDEHHAWHVRRKPHVPRHGSVPAGE